MKKILFLISIVLLCACNFPNTSKEVPFLSVTSFKYKGHSYIAFGTEAVVHDPDCQYCYDKFD